MRSPPSLYIGAPGEVVRGKLTRATTGVSATVEPGDRFGAAVAYRDDRTMAIGIPGEDLGPVIDAGSVQIARFGQSVA